MADARTPGPIGTTGDHHDLDDGTLVLARSPRPGPVKGPASPMAACLRRTCC